MAHSERFEKLCADAKTHIQEISTDEVARKLERGEPFELVDIREDRELEKGRIKGAKHIGRGVLERDIEKTIPDMSAEVVLYCGGGYRSALAAESLEKMGFKNVKSMAGGWREWLGKSLPTE